MGTKRDECCWCCTPVEPRIIYTRENHHRELIYPDLCPKCRKNRWIRKRFDGFRVRV